MHPGDHVDPDHQPGGIGNAKPHVGCTRMRAYTDMHTQTCAHRHTHTWKQTCTWKRTPTVRTHTHLHVNTHTDTHARHIDIYVQTYVHTYTMHTCMCVHRHKAHTCTHTGTHRHTCSGANTHAHTFAQRDTRVHKHTRHTQAHAHVCAHRHRHTHTHRCTHTRRHMHTPSSASSHTVAMEIIFRILMEHDSLERGQRYNYPPVSFKRQQGAPPRASAPLLSEQMSPKPGRPQGLSPQSLPAARPGPGKRSQDQMGPKGKLRHSRFRCCGRTPSPWSLRS